MALRAAILASTVLAMSSQQPASTVAIGTVLKLSPEEIRVQAPEETVAFRLNADTKVFKSRVGDDLSALRTGDLVSVRGVKNTSGAAQATAISAHSTTLRATIRKVDRAAGEILASSGSGEARRTRAFRYYSCTVFGASESALNPGAEILVVGLEFPDGGVDAARITIYHTDLPLDRAR